MLRCTAAGLIPLMNSRRYADRANTLFAEKRPAFDAIVEHKSYYLLRTLPPAAARALLLPALPAIAAKQMKNGLWRGKNAEKTAYDILSGLIHAGFSMQEAGLLSPLPALANRYGEHALLVKRTLGEAFSAEDSAARQTIIGEIAGLQAVDGSFRDTVTGTVIQLERMLELGMERDDPVIRRGAAYLLSQRKPLLQGMHTSEPYRLTMENVFTSNSREAEFQVALALRSEWLPRHVCFHTMAMIPNAVCLRLLLRLGLEDAAGVTSALDSLYALYRQHGGFCATNIKKPYL